MAGEDEGMIVLFDLVPELPQAIEDAVAEIVKKYAAATAELVASNAPVASGFLSSSVYYVTKEASTYGQAGTPPKDAYLLPEVDHPATTTEFTVAVAANYGEYVELGTRYMGAQPFLIPAFEAMQQALLAALSDLEPGIAEHLGGGGGSGE